MVGCRPVTLPRRPAFLVRPDRRLSRSFDRLPADPAVKSDKGAEPRCDEQTQPMATEAAPIKSPAPRTIEAQLVGLSICWETGEPQVISGRALQRHDKLSPPHWIMLRDSPLRGAGELIKLNPLAPSKATSARSLTWIEESNAT